MLWNSVTIDKTMWWYFTINYTVIPKYMYCFAISSLLYEFTSSSSSSPADSIQPSMCNARICRGMFSLHTWHAALGIFWNSVASDGSGVGPAAVEQCTGSSSQRPKHCESFYLYNVYIRRNGKQFSSTVATWKYRKWEKEFWMLVFLHQPKERCLKMVCTWSFVEQPPSHPLHFGIFFNENFIYLRNQ